MTTTGAQAWVADLYDAYVTTTVDIPFFVAQARAASGPVLELMAGTGRVALPLAAAGVALTCVDLSAPMLARLRAKLASRGLTAATYQMDVRELALPARDFALAILPFQSFAELLTPTTSGPRSPGSLPTWRPEGASSARSTIPVCGSARSTASCDCWGLSHSRIGLPPCCCGRSNSAWTTAPWSVRRSYTKCTARMAGWKISGGSMCASGWWSATSSRRWQRARACGWRHCTATTTAHPLRKTTARS